MGSHASQLTGEERWQVVNYVQKLRNDLLNNKMVFVNVTQRLRTQNEHKCISFQVN